MDKPSVEEDFSVRGLQCIDLERAFHQEGEKEQLPLDRRLRARMAVNPPARNA